MPMATMNYYVPKADVDEINNAREVLGDDYSPYIVRNLKQAVIDADMREKSYVEILLFEGTVQDDFGIRQGRDIKFIGKQLSARVGFDDTSIPYWYELYLTRKGKFLLYTISLDENTQTTKYSFKPYDSIKELQEKQLPGALLINAEKNMPNITCEFLDI